jgi:replicative DNA helicase
MSDLRGSGNIESDADLVMILQKQPQDEESEAPDVVNGFVVKNRQGRCPVVLQFEAHGATRTVIERHKPEQPPPHWQEQKGEGE